MKSAILYGSPLKLTKAHKPVHNHGDIGGNRQPEYFVRMDTVEGDVALAFDKAKPMTGETVLNTVPIR